MQNIIYIDTLEAWVEAMARLTKENIAFRAQAHSRTDYTITITGY